MIADELYLKSMEIAAKLRSLAAVHTEKISGTEPTKLGYIVFTSGVLHIKFTDLKVFFHSYLYVIFFDTCL